MRDDMCEEVQLRRPPLRGRPPQPPRRRQRRIQPYLLRARPNKHKLLLAPNLPVLTRRVPIANIPPRKLKHHRLGLPRLEMHTLKPPQHPPRILRPPKLDILHPAVSIPPKAIITPGKLTSCGTSVPATSPSFFTSACTRYNTSNNFAFPPGAPPAGNTPCAPGNRRGMPRGGGCSAYNGMRWASSLSGDKQACLRSNT